MPRQGSRGPDGNARPNSRHVAARASVSVGTVSNVLNRPDLVAPATREKVETVMREMGFVRNASARQLRMGKSQMVGLLVVDLVGPYFTAVAKGVEHALVKAGFMMTLGSSDRVLDMERRHLAQLEEQGVRGILVVPSTDDLSTIEEIRQRGTPVVLLDRMSPGVDQCSVAVDDVKGGEIATEHLLGLGHRRIGLILGPDSMPQAQERRNGVYHAVTNAGLDVNDILTEIEVPHLEPSDGEAAIAELMARDDPPTALMCMNDLVALGAFRALQQRGLRVPDDVALMGYGDVDFASVIGPGLTSVRRPKNELGRRAARLLLAEIKAEPDHLHEQVLFQPELIVRGSTRAG